MMSKFSTRLTIFGACIAAAAGLMASIAGSASAVTVPANPFTKNDASKTWTLNADITTNSTIFVPNGYTLNGNGHTITAIDPVGGGVFIGDAIVQNAGAAMNVKNLKIEGGVPNNCVAVFNGVAFINAGGSIKHVTLTNIGRVTGCQSGRAIFVKNTDPARKSVAIEGNTVTSYNKNGIDVRNNVDATIVGNTVTGVGPIDFIAQNGIVVLGSEAKAQVSGNKVSGNDYTPAGVEATGILAYDGATVTIDKKNTLFGNEVNILAELGGIINGKKYIPAP
jgi:hypothetical protein